MAIVDLPRQEPEGAENVYPAGDAQRGGGQAARGPAREGGGPTVLTLAKKGRILNRHPVGV
jgi:hypothetical protein